MRILWILALLIIHLKAIPLCQSYSESMKLWGGNVMQVLSLQVAMSAESSDNEKIGFGVGASTGVNYVHTDDDRDLGFGWRIKYLYLDSGAFNQKNHLVGGALYLHPFPNPYHKWSGAIQTHKDCENKDDGYPTPFSFLIGAGVNIANNNFGSQNGGYIEAGIALFKWFPMNGEIIYRLNIFPKNNLNFQEIQHSINFILKIL